MTRLGSELGGQPAEERSMAGLGSLERERPGVGGFVPQRVFLLCVLQVRRDRDPMRRAVLNLATRQLAAGNAHPRGTESETE